MKNFVSGTEVKNLNNPAFERSFSAKKTVSSHEKLSRLREDVFLAYVAGLIDADGCLSIAVENKNRRSPSIRGRVWISGEVRLLEAVKTILSNRHNIDSHLNKQRSVDIPAHRVHRDVYTLQIADSHSWRLIDLIEPILTLKEAQLKVLEVLHIEGRLGERWGRNGVPDYINDIRLWAYAEMKRLNSGHRKKSFASNERGVAINSSEPVVLH